MPRSIRCARKLVISCPGAFDLFIKAWNPGRLFTPLFLAKSSWSALGFVFWLVEPANEAHSSCAADLFSFTPSALLPLDASKLSIRFLRQKCLTSFISSTFIPPRFTHYTIFSPCAVSYLLLQNY